MTDERQRIRELIHDYCFNDQCDVGCVRCPVNKANACDLQLGRLEIPMENLHVAEKIINEERGLKK